MAQIVHVFVNGYGAPKDPLTDGNYERYLEQVLWFLNNQSGMIHLHLFGGFTNRTDLSEAAAMKLWFEHAGIPKSALVITHDRTTTARGNLIEFNRVVGDVPVVIFCEASREKTMRFFAGKLFSSFSIHGIPFDAKSLTPEALVEQRWQYRLEYLAWYLPPVDVVCRIRRYRHVMRARAAMRRA